MDARGRKLLIERASIDVEDRVPEPAVKLAVRDLALAASDYSNARSAKSTMTLRARVGERGRLACERAARDQSRLGCRAIDVSGLDLVTVRPYVESRINVTLTAVRSPQRAASRSTSPSARDARRGGKATSR